MSRPSWEWKLTLELIRDDESVGSRTARVGAFTEHLPWDDKVGVRAVVDEARHAARDLIRSTHRAVGEPPAP